MKKINSIGYGGKVILVGCVFILIIPMLLSIIPYKRGVLLELSKISFIVGTLILVLFFIWLMIELYQDKKLFENYNQYMNQKILIGKNMYECQRCGNRQVKQSDKNCNICGNKFI